MNPLTPTEDIRAARHKLAAKFDNKLDEIVADLQRQQAESDAEFITLPSRLPKQTTKQSLHGSGGSSGVVSGESTPAAP